MAAPSFSSTSRFNASFHSPYPRGQNSMLPSPNSTVNETMLVPEMAPIIPDLCMEQVWSETVTAGCCRYSKTTPLAFCPPKISADAFTMVTYIYSCRELNSQASKVFLTSDFCENRYLCFLVESHQHLRSSININISHISNSMHILGTI